jgi:hypothetical protein
MSEETPKFEETISHTTSILFGGHGFINKNFTGGVAWKTPTIHEIDAAIASLKSAAAKRVKLVGIAEVLEAVKNAKDFDELRAAAAALHGQMKGAPWPPDAREVATRLLDQVESVLRDE